MLAQHRLPPLPPATITFEASKALKSMLDAVSYPAYARNGRFDVVAWNAANTRMFGDFARIRAGGDGLSAVSLALSIYLDAINIFLAVLQLMSGRRRN